jgi:hypothetical protein
LKPDTDELVCFYNPRVNRWYEHFWLNEARIEPLTDIGEATIHILHMNHDEQILERQVLSSRRRYPNEPALLLITEH